MLMSSYFNKAKYVLMGLLTAVLLLSSSNFAFAQSGFDPEKEFFNGAKVLSINGNIVQCELDLTADISNADVKRTIEVGDLLYTTGQLVSDANFKSLLKAETVTVIKTRDVILSGTISDVSAAGLTIFGQPVILNDKTEIIGAAALVDGQAALVSVEFQNGVFTAYKVSVLEAPDGIGMSILSRITNIEGTKLSLVGDFTVNATAAQIEILEKNNFGIGSPLTVELNQAVRKKKIKRRQIADLSETYPTFFGKSIGGKPQAIDSANKTVTINNLVLTVSAGTSIYGEELKLIKLSDVNLNDYDFVVAEYTEIDGANFLTTLIFNKKK